MRYIQADFLFTGTGEVEEKSIVHLNEEGKILNIWKKGAEPKDIQIEYYQGAICPGFVNTHCHLELSHMKGLVATGTSLLPFLKSVVTFRDFPDEIINQAIIEGDREMWENGIVAVGDISNKLDTADTKSKSKIKYYTFVEMFDFLQDTMTATTIKNYKKVFDGQSDVGGNKKSFVPHAPYTVTKGLFAYIKSQNDASKTVSIHNQETVEEDMLFKTGKSGFIDFFSGFGFDMSGFKPTGKPSIQYSMENMNPKCKTIQVHNTKSTSEDIQAAHQWSNNIFWASCPNANLYIENSLPNYQLFLDNDATMTLGTDSLTSNWKLNIVSEILTIQKYCSYVPLQTLIKWACHNGAKALGYEDQLGSMTVGKSPGINIINVIKSKDQYILMTDKVTKLC